MRQRATPRALVHHLAYGEVAGLVTQLLIQMDGSVITPLSWCPAFPRAAKALRAAITAQCAADTTPGNWTLRLRKNESFVTDEATISFGLTTTLTKTAAVWSSQVVFEAGDTYYIVADGPSKTDVLCRFVLEWEVL